MSEITFYTEKARTDNFGTNHTATYTPHYFAMDGRSYFIGLLTSDISDAAQAREAERFAANMEGYKAQIVKNRGEYFCYYAGRFNDPFLFLAWVKEKGYTLIEPNEGLFDNLLFNDDNYDSVDFHGNLKEESYAFYFRIYSKEVAERLKAICRGMGVAAQ